MDTELFEFEKYMGGENKNTTRKYLIYIGRVKDLLHKNLKDMTEDDLIGLLVRLKKNNTNASTYNSYITSMRAYFYHFLKRNFPSPRDKRFRQRIVYDDERVLDKVEQSRLFKVLNADDNPLYKALFGLCAYGMRLGEAIYIYEEHINRKDMIIEVKRTKHFTPKYMDRTKIDRYIPIGNDILQWIDAYKKVRPAPESDADAPLVFLDNRKRKRVGKNKSWESVENVKNYGKPLKERDMEREFKKFLIKVNLNPSYHPHHLRSSYITDRLEEGSKIHDVMIASGHTQSKNLDKYVRIKDKRSKVQNINRDIFGGGVSMTEKICETCGRKFDGWGNECSACKSADRATDMAVGDKGR